MVPDAEFRSYYGRPVLKDPAWKTVDVAAYLFLGGLAGASSALAAAAHRAGYDELATVARITAGGAISGSAAALVHDLGRPARFINMLRVFKVTSPMSLGSWLLAAYGPVAGASAAAAITGKLPKTGRAAATVAGVMGPAVATYTAALICNTAVPAWHDAHREMPYLFAGSAAAAAGGVGLLTLRPDQAVPAARLAVAGAVTELAAGCPDRAPPRPGRRAVPEGRAGRADAGRPGAHRHRRGRRAGRPGPQPLSLHDRRGHAGGGLRGHQIRRVPRGPGKRP